MVDTRFFLREGPFSLGYVAAKIGAQIDRHATERVSISDVAPLEGASGDDVGFFGNVRYAAAFRSTRAAAVITNEQLAAKESAATHLLIVADPQVAFARVVRLFYPLLRAAPMISPAALIDPSATIGSGARVEPGAVIRSKAVIGSNCHIRSYAVIDSGVMLGNDCTVGEHSAISHAIIGRRVKIATGVSIGGEGFGFVLSSTGRARIPHVGRVLIGDDVEIGANCSVDRGSIGDTIIGPGTVLDNLVQIAHNVHLGKNCIICGQAGVAGSTVIGDNVVIGGQAAISDHLSIGPGARIAGKSGVMRDVKAGSAVGGYPAMPIRQWHWQTAILSHRLGRENVDAVRTREMP